MMHTPSVRFAAVVLALSLCPAPVLADFDDPPKIDCRQKKNKSHPSCQPKRVEATQEELFNAAYWMNRTGRHREALGVLRRADTGDPRVLNETGYAVRKLGDPAGALVYYRRALEIDPGYVAARSYMGEALLVQGDVASARAELDDIARRCGTDCTAYVSLSAAMAAFPDPSSRR
jgi:tetratricopeptide (TPR) repeat protein